MFNVNWLEARNDLGEINLSKIRFWVGYFNPKIGFDIPTSVSQRNYPHANWVPSCSIISQNEIKVDCAQTPFSARSKVISLGLRFKEGSFLTREKQLELHGVKIK